MTSSVFANMNRADLHRIVKSQISNSPAFDILEESRYRFDPESERKIRECLRKLESIAANSRLIDRNESATEGSGNVLHLVKRAGMAA
jgi:hypothetical protein